MEPALVRIGTELLEETYESLAAMARARGWTIEEAARIMIHEGMASIIAEETRQKIEGLPDAEKVVHLLRQLKDVEADYASLKFQNFTFMQDNKILQMNLTGYKCKAESLETFVNELKKEMARLKTAGQPAPG